MSDDLFPPETAPMFGASRRAQCVVCSRVALLPYPNVELCGPCIDDEEAQQLRAQRGYDDLAEQINIASQEWFAMVIEMPIEQTERWLRIVTAIMLGEDLHRIAATLRRYPVLQPYHAGLLRWRAETALHDSSLQHYREIISEYGRLREVRGG